MSCASLPQFWNTQTALLMAFQQTPTCTCLLIKPDEDCTAQLLNEDLLWTQNSFTWCYLRSSPDHSAPPCAVDPISPCYFTKQRHERRGKVGSCKCSEAVKAAVVLLTEDVDSGGAVAGACHAAGHAGVIPPVLQPNPLQVQAPVAAHAHVGTGNQLPKERRNLSLGKYSLTRCTWGCSVALLGYVTLLKIIYSCRILIELFLLSVFHTKLILLKSFSSTSYLLLELE